MAGELETSSYYGWMNLLAFNVGYHQEHHDFPTVPFTRLPDLKRIGDYDQLPSHRSWVAVLWKFLTDPCV